MKILHLYPHLMNLYGDYGNVLVLAKHLIDQGFDVTVDKKEVGDDFNLLDYDFIYMGPGIESNLFVALNDLQKHSQELIDYIESNKTLLFTGCAMELLGKTINNENGLGILDFNTELTDKRFTGDVIVHNDLIGDVVGFINKCSLISNGENNKLFTYEFKDNNLVDNDYEGYRYKNAFGTHIIGPVLAKNPKFIETIIKCIAPNDFEYKNIDYKYEEASYQVTLNALRGRK